MYIQYLHNICIYYVTDGLGIYIFSINLTLKTDFYNSLIMIMIIIYKSHLSFMQRKIKTLGLVYTNYMSYLS